MIRNEALLQSVAKPEDESGISQPFNRREFLTYAWSAALALLAVQSGGAIYTFLQPRFQAGEFGGKFSLGAVTTLPADGDAPQANAAGKFWLVNTATGPRAIYMVCTHLGCLYKWNAQENRFRCPCHGSTFSREGDYICGPASRSLDQFVIEVMQDGAIVGSTNTDATGVIQPPTASAATVELVVNTGKRLRGQAGSQSPVRDQTQCEE
jgi:cytochrome b6-f complex iron-sulfur subunit